MEKKSHHMGLVRVEPWGAVRLQERGKDSKHSRDLRGKVPQTIGHKVRSGRSKPNQTKIKPKKSKQTNKTKTQTTVSANLVL